MSISMICTPADTVARSLCFAAALVIAGPLAATAAYAQSKPGLSLRLSMEALNEAIRACDAKGYKVAVSVVDTDGVIKVQARGDESPIHSQRFSFRKAYTIVSMGPMFGVDASSALVKSLSASPQGLANVQSGETPLLFIPGGAIIRAGKSIVGAIGVSGAPSSFEDEACAMAGVAKCQTGADSDQK